MARKKVCFIISDVNQSHLLEEMGLSIDKYRYDVSFIFLAPSVPKIHESLQSAGQKVHFIRCSAKKDLPATIISLYTLLRDARPDIVHTHLFNASIAGLTAAMLAGIKRRVHTRHHSVEAHRYHPHAVYYDKYINALSTDIVAITDLVRDVLVEKESVRPEKVRVIRHGFRLDKFDESGSSVDSVKVKYGLNKEYPVIGVISRFIHWKGVQFIIPAFRELLGQYPNAKLVLANATGSYGDHIHRLLSGLDKSRYVLIDFESNISDLFRTFDVFVHVPIGPDFEAFGQVYVEALALKIPSVFTLSGIANDFIRDGKNAIVVPYCDAEAVYKAVNTLLKDALLRRHLAEAGYSDVHALFDVKRMVSELDCLYSES